MNFNQVTNSEIKKINRGFGMKMHPIHKRMKMHHGIDIPVSTGHNIYAIADGVIIDSTTRNDGCGGTIKVDHGMVDGKQLYTRFCHCSDTTKKKKGDFVKKGDVIGLSGGGKGDPGRGGSTGSHIHFEVYENGKTVDPMPYYTGGKQINSQEKPTGSLPKDNSEPSTNIPKDSNSDSEIKKFGSSFSDSDIGNFLKIFSPDYENFSREEKNRALLPIFSMLGFDTLRDLLDNPNVVGKKDEDGDVQDAINQIKNKMDSKDLNTTSVSDKISSLPPKIKNAIDRLKNEYGITITDEHIRKEFEQEGNYREDAGGENSEARKNIEKLVQDAKLKFGGKIPKNAIISGYRGYDDQVKNFGNKAKSRGVDNTQKANTIPGFSQHHTGKAFDIFSVDTSWWNRNSDVKEWVAKNAKNYGFDVTYKTQGLLRIAEPWHLYYVGGETISEHAMGKIFEITEEILRFKTLIK